MTGTIGFSKSDLEAITEEKTRPARLYYVDWIRLLATFGVFIYHASRPFIMQEWLIENETKSIILTLFFLVFLGSWGMPLFFFVSGSSSLFALRRRSGRQYAGERVQRLLIPFIVGVIVLSPFQFYLEWIHKGWYEGPFLPFIPLIIEDRLTSFSQRISPTLFESLGSHLWFLGFLFAFSLLALPLFLWFKREMGGRFLNWLGKLGEVQGGLLLFVIPVVLSRVLLQEKYFNYTDWADFTYMFVFFVLGYILFADDRFVNAIYRDGKLVLAVGLVVTATIVAALASGAGREWIENPGSAGYYLGWTLASVNGWCWTLVALSFGMRYMQVRNKWLVLGGEAILPFYVFHQPVIVIIAFYVVGWPVTRFFRWIIIVIASFFITFGLFQLVIKRIGPLRILFGMKPSG